MRLPRNRGSSAATPAGAACSGSPSTAATVLASSRSSRSPDNGTRNTPSGNAPSIARAT